ncbi:MAG TPA: glycosyltransferase family 2 protein [Gemmataceae bacterium]|jgi:glycosyltransferase involved in cell wall biosynthesis
MSSTRMADVADSLTPTSVVTPAAETDCELTVVIPCLNEAETLGNCITKALRALKEHEIHGEVVVGDNGSTDGSVSIAEEVGARVVDVTPKGYGNALMGGIGVARGRYIIMGDADDSYDFLEIPRFLAALRSGYDLVQGCRLPSGGGRVLPGAMKFTHRWIGNPFFSRLARIFFGAPVHDIYCGMRGFTKSLYQRLDMRCTGMEFATEMIIKASLFQEKIAEVPITLHPDGRKTQRSHLRTFRDGWRTLRFFMCFSPKWLFLLPGLGLIGLGLLGYLVAMPGLTVFGAMLDAHTLLIASLALILGYQCVQFAIFAKTFAINEGLLPTDSAMERFYHIFRLERGLLTGFMLTVAGGVLIIVAVNMWRLAHFGNLNYAHTMRLVIPGVTSVVIGFQTILSSFYIGILRMARK